MVSTKSKQTKKGFTLVELLVVITLLAVLSAAAYWGIQRSMTGNMNGKVEADLLAIQTALNRYKEDQGHYPNFEDLALSEDKNVLCFDEAMAYTHDCEKAAFLQTQVDNKLLTKRYLREVPIDPRTNSRYSYGVTAEGEFFQVAGVQEMEEESWMAKVVGNVQEGSPFPSLIRAYDGPDFVVHDGPFLPYSPNPNEVSASLYALKGNVTVNGGKAIEGQRMLGGDKINAGANASVVLYVSDGSITYLDSNSELELKKTSEVTENTDDNIATKVKMKLLQGSVWNKVVRLSEGSEFNIETTSAIAGVRGTEFGMTANKNEVVVRSGVVAGRLKTQEQKADEDFDFSVKDALYDNQEAKGNGTDFLRFKLPAQGQNMPQGVALSANEVKPYLEKYYNQTSGQVPLSLAYQPYLVKAQAHANGGYSIYFAFNGLNSDNTLKVDGVNLYGMSQTSGIQTLKEGETPLAESKPVTYIPEEEAYKFEISKTDPLEKEGEMESILIQAYQMVNNTPVHSQLSWPGIGLQPDPTEEYTYTFDNSEVYDQFEGSEEDVKGPLEIQEPEETTVALNEPNFPLEASAACNWGITQGGGVLTESENVEQTNYQPLAEGLTAEEKAQEVGQRFDGVASEPVKITCTDPEDPNNSDEIELTVNYAPKTISSESGYWYSYLVKAEISWNDANTACINSEEGGIKDWTLPSKIIYENLNSISEEINLCEIENEKCAEEELKSLAYFILLEDSLYNFTNNKFLFPIPDKSQSSPSFGVRCVINN